MSSLVITSGSKNKGPRSNLKMDQDGNNNKDVSSPIQEFYRDGCALITGATGFVGKALVEKLLRACPDIGSIYLLIRPKKGKTSEERFIDYFKSEAFDHIRGSECLKKVQVVTGDVTEPDLGLNEFDKNLVINNVTIVFHSAATVKFNETLQDAVSRNAMGTLQVLQLCKQIKHLQVAIHVSTAYSNADRKEIREEVYDPAVSPGGLLECMKYLDKEMIEILSPAIMRNHPNTYTITKNLAEKLVSEHAKEIPVGILRPSIVVGAWQDPYPGWVESVSGITGIMMECGRGTIRSIVCDKNCTVDIIPVDVVVDSLIVAAFNTAQKRDKGVVVYNCTSGSINPIHWRTLGELLLKYSVENPTKYVQWYPSFKFTTSRRVHALYDFILHTIPAFFLDCYLWIQGSKPIMLKIAQKFRIAAQSGEFFALHEWKFTNDNQLSLSEQLSEEDKKIFRTDISKLDWDDYVRNFVLGIRKYVLRDTPDTIPAARRKLNWLYWLRIMSRIFFVYLFITFFLRR